MSGLIRCGLFSPSDGTLVSSVQVQRGVGDSGTGHASAAKWGLQPCFILSMQTHFKKLSHCKVSKKRLSEESTDGSAPLEERRKAATPFISS